MSRGEHRAIRSVGSADRCPPNPPVRSWWARWHRFIALCLIATMMSAATAALPNVTGRITGTSALYASRAETQVNTIKAGSWGVPTPAGCTGTYDVALHTSQLSLVDFEASLTAHAVVYFDKAGNFNLKGYAHLCIVLSVLGVNVINLDATVQIVVVSGLLGTLCGWLPIPIVCGGIGGLLGGFVKQQKAGLMALAAPAQADDSSFAQQIQGKITDGEVTSLSMSATGTGDDSADGTSTAPLKARTVEKAPSGDTTSSTPAEKPDPATTSAAPTTSTLPESSTGAAVSTDAADVADTS